MQDLAESIKREPKTVPKRPWVKVGAWAIGGMRAIGYSDCSRYILVETSDGRGLFDCETGDKYLRDRTEYVDQELKLLCEGFGPLMGQSVRMAGLHGGGLPTFTPDGWQIEVISSWPKNEILLLEPGSWLHGAKYGKPHNFQKIWTGFEIRGCGFSFDGRTLCIGESSDLVIYSRQNC